MPRVIFKCPHIKPGTDRAAAHLNHYVRYISTREGVDHVDPGKVNLPVTEKQWAMVERIVRELPLSRGMLEYEDYLAAPTRGNASEFITRAIEDNADLLAKRENYVDYIASRPRAERVGSHGLFTGEADSLVLSKVAEAVANHPGTVWLPIISLRREDADRLGYNSARQWRELLAGFAPQIAAAMKIPPEQFRWYAAFHDEGHHPHLHMVCYSADAKAGFLSQNGIAQIKSGLAKEIFRQELTEIYQQQTRRRDELTQESRDALSQLIDRMRSGTLESPVMEQLMLELAERLKRTGGKKQYGYLRPPLKSIVDQIVNELEKDPRIAAAYDLWYQLQEEVLRTYKNDLPPRLPLSQQKEFKRIKNLVIEEAIRLGEYTELFEDSVEMESDELGMEQDTVQAVIWFTQAAEQEDPYAMYTLGKLNLDVGNVPAARRWFQKSAELGSPFAQYRLGKLLLSGEDAPKDVESAIRWLTEAAGQGNQFAQYALGKMYLLGQDIPQNREAAVHWLTLAAEQGNASAQYFLDHINDGPSVFSSATRLLHHMSRIFQEQTPPSPHGLRFVDSKLRQKIREKKIAMGHKPDDHEDQPTMTY